MTTALTPEQIKQRLRYQGKQYSAGGFARGGSPEERHYLEQAADLIEALEAELAACKKDAERYRWLRDTNKERTDMTTGKGILWPNEVSSVWWGLPEDQWDFFSGCLRCADGPEFDTAIDAAMAAQEKA